MNGNKKTRGGEKAVRGELYLATNSSGGTKIGEVFLLLISQWIATVLIGVILAW